MELPVTVYVAIVKEPEVEAYALTDGYADLEAAKMMIKHRGEEFIDELAESDAEAGNKVDHYTLEISTTGLAIRVLGSADRGLLGKVPVLMQIDLYPVLINDIVVPVREQQANG